MEVVGAALRDDADDAAEGRLVFGVVARLLDLYRLDEVLRDDLRAADRRSGTRARVGAVDAVDEVAVFRTGRAVDHQAARAALGHTADRACVLIVRARNLSEKADEAAALRHGLDHLFADRRGGRIGLGIDERSFAHDLHSFGHGSKTHGQVDFQRLAEGDSRRRPRGRETRQSSDELIGTRCEGRKAEDTGGVSDAGDNASVSGTARLDGNSGNHAALSVLDNPLNGSALLLRECGLDQGKDQKNEQR